MRLRHSSVCFSRVFKINCVSLSASSGGDWMSKWALVHIACRLPIVTTLLKVLWDIRRGKNIHNKKTREQRPGLAQSFLVVGAHQDPTVWVG